MHLHSDQPQSLKMAPATPLCGDPTFNERETKSCHVGKLKTTSNTDPLKPAATLPFKLRARRFLSAQKEPKTDHIVLRYFLWSCFCVVHITIMLIVMLGPAFCVYCLLLHPMVQLQWYLLDYQCIATYIERWLHPYGKSIYGKIRWWSMLLLWVDFFAFYAFFWSIQ